MTKFFKSLFFVATLFVLTVVLSPLTVNAQGSDSKTVRIGYYQNEVFEDGAADGEIKKGYAYEYYRKISEYTGWEYEYVYGDFVSIYKKLLKGEVDLVAGLAKTEDRASLILFPEKAMGWESYGLVKHDSDRSITQDKSTLNGHTIGVLNSAVVNALNTFLENEGIDAKVVPFNDYETLLKAFDRKEMDVIAVEIDGIYDRDHAEVLYTFGVTDYYIGVNKNRNDILVELDNAQTQLFIENRDYLSSLHAKYYPSTLSRKAFSRAEIEWISAHKTINIGYLDDFLPYSGTGDDGKVTGVISDIFPYLFKELGLNGIEYNYHKFNNYDDMINAVQNEEIDVAFPVGGGLFFSEEDGMYLSNPVISAVTDLVFTDEYAGSTDFTVAVSERNKLQYYYIRNTYPDANIKKYTDIDSCLNAVLNGDVTFTAINGLRTSSILKKRDYSKLSFIQGNGNDDSCFGVKIGNDGLLKLLNRGVSVEGQDYAQNQAIRYTQTMYSVTLYDFLRKYFLYIIIAIVIISSLIILTLLRSIKRNIAIAKEKESARIEVEKANHDNFVFVNKMANYMREPLKSIMTLLNQSKKANNIEEIKGNLDDMAYAGRELVSIINNILNMSRLESGQIAIEDQNIVHNFYDKRILIAEDSATNEMITGKIMKKFGFEIHYASDGYEAYDRLNAAPSGYFDAVIIDVENHEKDEYNSAINIRKMDNPDKADIPIIAIISDEAELESRPFSEAKINGVFYKPYELSQLKQELYKIFE